MIAFLHAHLLLILLAASGVLVGGAAGFVVHHVLVQRRLHRGGARHNPRKRVPARGHRTMKRHGRARLY